MICLDVEVATEENQNIKEKETYLTKFKNFVIKQILPIGTIFSITFGLFLPQPAVYLSERIPVSQICVMVLFFCLGLRLRLDEAKCAIKCYKEIVFGVIFILFVCPIIGTNILTQVHQFGPLIGSTAGQDLLKNDSNSSSQDIKLPIFGPEEFRLALQIYIMCPSAVATTLIMVGL